MRGMRKGIRTLRLEGMEKDKKIERLEERIKELEGENQRLKGTGKKLKEIIFKENKKDARGNKRGAKISHQGFVRRKPKEEEVTFMKEVSLCKCPECNGDLSGQKPYAWTERYGIDIPLPVQPIITKYHIAKYNCKNCKRWVQGIPVGMFGKSPFGINLMMLVLHMKYRGRATDVHIRETLETCYAIDLSAGAVHGILERTTQLFGSSYEGIKQAIREGKYVHADETGWRVEGENWHTWVFTHDKAVLYTIENTRGGGIATNMLEGFNGVLVRDGYQGYDQVKTEQQLCLIHFLRHTKGAAEMEQAPPEVLNFHTHMKWFFRKVRKLHKKCYTKESRLQLYDQMQRVLQQFWKNKKYADARLESIRLWWLERRHQHLLTFLKYDYVPWDNNAAERAIRPFVMRRKVSGGSRSKRGAEREAINMSCIHTILKQGKSIFDEIPNLFQPQFTNS